MDFPFLELAGAFVVLLDFLILVFFFVSSTLSSGSLQTVKVKLRISNYGNFQLTFVGTVQGMLGRRVAKLEDDGWLSCREMGG